MGSCISCFKKLLFCCYWVAICFSKIVFPDSWPSWGSLSSQDCCSVLGANITLVFSTEVNISRENYGFLFFAPKWVVIEAAWRPKAHVPAPGTWPDCVGHHTRASPRADHLLSPGLFVMHTAPCFPTSTSLTSSRLLPLTHSPPATWASFWHFWILSPLRLLPTICLPLLPAVHFSITPEMAKLYDSLHATHLLEAPRT